ncbi:MAG TPA: phosphoglucosamine mutase [Kiritimatiellae bacterium]|nr:phosphoglucosamine mutase [Kiritimatiellia bacterium]
MSRLFGTDGVRGIANMAPMTAEMILEIGRATAYVCKHREDHRHRIVIGKDTRLSGYMVENALTAGICSMGVDVYLVGPMPTPGIAFITQSMRADAGMVISASHNPYQDNGIKIFARDGYKLPDAVEDEIEELIISGRIREIRPTADQIGKAHRIEDASGRYIVFCKGTFPADYSLEGTKIVIDCANGAGYRVAPLIFYELGAEVVTIHTDPDGLNINAHCGSQYPEDLRAKVLEEGADAGFALDGDGDRVIAVDEKGGVLDGDHIIALCARYYQQRGWLEPPRIVTTAMANYGLLRALERMNIAYDVVTVGDRYVIEKMRETGALIGGESSGHIIFHDHHTTGDGIVSALQVLAAMQASGQPLSQLGRLVEKVPQKLVNVEVARRVPLEGIRRLQREIRDAETELSGRGRILVRYSGTQPLCRVMVEADDEELADRISRQIAEVVAAELSGRLEQ